MNNDNILDTYITFQKNRKKEFDLKYMAGFGRAGKYLMK